MFRSYEWLPNTIYLAQDMVVQTTLGEVRVELREDGWYFRDNDLCWPNNTSVLELAVADAVLAENMIPLATI